MDRNNLRKDQGSDKSSINNDDTDLSLKDIDQTVSSDEDEQITRSSSSSPPSSSDSDSSCDLDPNDAIQSPLAGLLNFEGFSMPQIRDLRISNIDMPNFSALPSLPYINLPTFQGLPSLAGNLPNLSRMPNLSNLSNLPTLSNIPNLPNVPYLAYFSNLSTNLPTLSQIKSLSNLPNLTQFTNTQAIAEFNNLLSLIRFSTSFPSLRRFVPNSLLKQWPQHRLSVRNIYRRLDNILKRSPSSFNIFEWESDHGQQFARVYFLLDDTIHFCDIRLNENYSDEFSLTQAKPLLPEYSKKISSYVYEPKYSRFIFSSATDIYYFDDNPRDSELIMIPRKIQTPCKGKKTDYQTCPSNPDLLAFNCAGSLWCINLKSSDTKKLTYLPKEVRRDDCFLVAKPSRLMEEEFNRKSGYWWQSNCRIADSTADRFKFRILYEETDQSNLDFVGLFSYNIDMKGHRYARVGSSNPISRLKLVEFQLRGDIMHGISHIDISAKYKNLFKGYDYLIRVGWLNDETIWCQLLNRKQDHIVVVLISLDDRFEAQILYEEHSKKYWIKPHDHLSFLSTCDCKNEGLVSFIWSNQSSGFRHLYLISVQLTDQSKSRLISKYQLSHGPWEIDETELWVDETKKLIYFSGSKETPLEKHLYVLNYGRFLKENTSVRHMSRIDRLTNLNYSNTTVSFNQNLTIFVNLYSNINSPPIGYLNSISSNKKLPVVNRISPIFFNPPFYLPIDSCQLGELKTVETSPSLIHDYQHDLLPGLSKPELFRYKLTSGEIIYGSLFKPEFMEQGLKYPAVLDIYGGPEIQTVTNSFIPLRQPHRHLLASEGYVVITIDARGSGRRGIRFEAHQKGNMGQVGLSDQVEVLKWLCEKTEYIDPSRIAIKGWSHGGFLALMGLINYPEVFKLAIAGAPVTNWSYYDTAFTERYMGLFHENKKVYKEGNISNYADMFPDQANRLLLIHGLLDENVHFHHTSSLIKALVDAGKPYDLQIFPSEGHSVESQSCRESCMASILSYLQLNL